MKQVVLQLPGWQGSSPDHWQTHWQVLYGDERVEQLDWDRPLRGDWQIALQNHMWDVKTRHESIGDTESVYFWLIGHGLGCHLIRAWATYSPHVNWVLGAFLVAPLVLSHQPRHACLKTWYPIDQTPLPFPSMMLTSLNDSLAPSDASRDLAKAWGSQHVELTDLGHINANSGLGDWPQGRAVFEQFKRLKFKE